MALEICFIITVDLFQDIKIANYFTFPIPFSLFTLLIFCCSISFSDLLSFDSISFLKCQNIWCGQFINDFDDCFMWVCLRDNGTTVHDGCEISCHVVVMEQWSLIRQMFDVEGVFQK